MVFFKVAGVAAFGLSLTLTACDHSSNNNLGFAAELCVLVGVAVVGVVIVVVVPAYALVFLAFGKE